ncbi:MAG: ABC transporter ATP-binding protein [Candidatus Hodarchaeales archaeon]|jgi:ABC-2 type transport system ATP-binding protein
MIELTEVSKSFGDVVAVSRLSMTANQGVTGFLGPNGAGKSTTLKLIMGEINPDAGIIRVFDENPMNNANLKQRIGYVSEHEDLYPWMKGKQFVTSLARLILPREQAETAAKEAIKKVGLSVKGKRVKSYSKGMKQRLKVAAAIVHHPELLILDEPFGGLDPLGRREMKQLIADLNQEGVTVLISSHILYELDEMSTRMVLIHRGQTLAEGPPAEILNIIDQFPHQILFNAPYKELQKLSQLLIGEDIINTVHIKREEDNVDLIVTTDNPNEFYSTATQIIADNNLLIRLLASQTDNIESIFEYLT